MEDTSIHAFLYKKYKDLAPELSAVLKEMKKEGVIEKYIILAREVCKKATLQEDGSVNCRVK